MKKNRLGSSDLLVGEIGLGCMSIGTEEQQAVYLIHEALDRGVNLLDTADLYQHGRNEEIVGAAIRGRRQDVILATKVGNRRIPGQEGWGWDPSKKYILSAVKESLRRLGTDYIDLYQLHGGTIDDPIDETIEAFEQLQQEGVIRYYGISSIRPHVIREYVERSNIVSVMNQYSLLDRRAEEEVLSLLQERGISVIARGPVASGVLADKGEEKAAKGYLDYEEAELLDMRKQLKAFAGPERSMEQTAIRYSLSHPAVAAVIPGASSLGQLEHNISAADIAPLTEHERETLQQICRANRYDAQYR
ncbi:aldo/keto reductase [Paenibacillus sp. EKM202P]|uniref:aldo/keto reductase n=1 Tax=Paenibacillus TaxID=44249 RepID=UPI0013EB4443|nr:MULTISPECIES: aldo/keto reductase [unclassified Paenibacillus]KAF6562819.1 aldo/keto reductase [Paenibacillus sp. EKM202P]KAF6568967.1 aldo/keto reductase [Paenibacillus sp. EKM207P]MCV9951291.1 aldo/keto reductase [Paenibacillus sp. BT-177]